MSTYRAAPFTRNVWTLTTTVPSSFASLGPPTVMLKYRATLKRRGIKYKSKLQHNDLLCELPKPLLLVVLRNYFWCCHCGLLVVSILQIHPHFPLHNKCSFPQLQGRSDRHLEWCGLRGCLPGRVPGVGRVQVLHLRRLHSDLRSDWDLPREGPVRRLRRGRPGQWSMWRGVKIIVLGKMNVKCLNSQFVSCFITCMSFQKSYISWNNIRRM